MEEEIPKQKPNKSFNRRLFVSENWGEHDNGQVKMFKKFILQRNMTKGEYG